MLRTRGPAGGCAIARRRPHVATRSAGTRRLRPRAARRERRVLRHVLALSGDTERRRQSAVSTLGERGTTGSGHRCDRNRSRIPRTRRHAHLSPARKGRVEVQLAMREPRHGGDRGDFSGLRFCRRFRAAGNAVAREPDVCRGDAGICGRRERTRGTDESISPGAPACSRAAHESVSREAATKSASAGRILRAGALPPHPNHCLSSPPGPVSTRARSVD